MNRILLSPDPLDTNVSDIDTSFPKIPANLYDLKIEKAEKVPNSKGTGDNLKIALKTTTNIEAVTGEQLAAGSVTLFNNISLAETPKYTVESIKKNVAALAKAAGLGSMTVRQILDDPQILVGKVVRAKVGIQKETDEYPESNNIKQFMVTE